MKLETTQQCGPHRAWTQPSKWLRSSVPVPADSDQCVHDIHPNKVVAGLAMHVFSPSDVNPDYVYFAFVSFFPTVDAFRPTATATPLRFTVTAGFGTGLTAGATVVFVGDYRPRHALRLQNNFGFSHSFRLHRYIKLCNDPVPAIIGAVITSEASSSCTGPLW